MKLPLLLSQYLREHSLLRLPGLGIFHSHATAPATEGAPLPPLDIRFEHATVREPDDKFIEFIRQKTGKIKPLALADLSSYIESGLQLLNIGKPFYIEGLGTIQKTKEGKYDFVQRELAASKDESTPSRQEQQDQQEKRKSVFDEEKYSPAVNPWQKIIVAALIIGGLAIVVLGGYYLYNQNNAEATVQDSVIPATDTTTNKQNTLQISDSTSSLASNPSTPAGSYKFIIETTNNKKRAIRRYKQLIDFTNVKMETADSVSFKLYFVIPGSDTTRIKDSLSRFYASKVRIEK